MNIFKKLTLLAACLASFSLVAWNGELVQISKGNRSYGFMIRNYTGSEWYHLGKILDFEGFKPDKIAGYVKKSSGTIWQGLGFLRRLEVFFTSDQLYTYCKQAINNTDVWQVRNDRCTDELRNYDRIVNIFVGVIEDEQDQNDGNCILSVTKEAFKKIAAEDSSIKYEEIKYKNGRPDISIWTKFKNFVVNEKFLYAMAGLSALYLGYEYMNQK